jgi:hypothetical protein
MFLTVLALVACGGSTTTYKGTQMSDFFPLDGDVRQAFYTSEGGANGQDLVITKLLPTENIDGNEVVTLEYGLESDADGSIETVIGAVKWSNDDGIQIYAWSEGAGGEFTVYDPPVVVAKSTWLRDDPVETVTGGLTFTSTFVGFENCPVTWGEEWDDCAHIRLDDGDGDDSVGPMFAGDYWLVTRYGIAWMQNTGTATYWDLKNHRYTPPSE